ncbi:MAG: SDR family NAD(P)-dependent oxidoreductase [Bacteroidales bacterium]|nr:MAG: SDR family NAD(P)-dependent oxidoreductase [Bacteroidales bacterium]
MKQVLITGGAGGLGKHTALYLANKGWHIYAADNDQAGLHKLEKQPGITPVFMDITDENSVNMAFNKVSGMTDGLDAIVNLAGILILGSVAELPAKEIERILDINLLGAYRTNRKFLPLLVKHSGRIINISSETGWQTAAPFNGPYALSKHALEAYSDALRRELSLLNIPVIKIRPGPFKTGFTQEIGNLFANARQNSIFFKENLSIALQLSTREYEKAADPGILARTIHKAITRKKPKIRYSVKPDKFRVILELIPVRWADFIIKSLIRKQKTN